MSDWLRLLCGTDRRSIGQADRVVAAVLKNPRAFAAVFTAMLSDDPVVRMRAADNVCDASARGFGYPRRKLVRTSHCALANADAHRHTGNAKSRQKIIGGVE